MIHENIDMIRGDTLAFGFELDGVTEVDAVYFSVKKTKYDDEYVFIKSLNDGIAKIEDGKYSVRVAPADTHDLDVGTYYYDLQIEANGDVFTVLYGTLEMEADITRDVVPPEPTPPEPPTPPSLLKGGWYYGTYSTQAIVGHFDVENSYLYIINFDLTDINNDHDNLNGGQWTEYELDGNTITTAAGLELHVDDDGTITFPLFGITFEYDDNLDINVLRRLNNG